MAGYRPKSLDELNNLYDKAISAENEIKKGSSLLKSEVLESSFEAPENQSMPSSVRPIHPKEISNDVDSFIKQFAEKNDFLPLPSSQEPQRKRPAPLADLQPKTPVNPEPAPAQKAQARIQKPDPQKEENLSGLMNDYAKIMSGDYDDDDEDDETFSSRKNLFKNRRNERKGKKKAAKDIITENEVPNTGAVQKGPVAEPELGIPPRIRQDQKAFVPAEKEPEEQAVTAEEQPKAAFSLNEKAKEAIEKTAPVPEIKTETEKEEKQAIASVPEAEATTDSAPAEETDRFADYENEPYDDSLDVPFERNEEDGNFDFGEIESQKRSGKAVFAKVLLSIILVLTLVATALTGACVFTVNSERSLAGYMFFSATNSYEDAEVRSNDFVICKKSSSIADGQKVIFINRELRSFSFGVKTGEKTTGNGTEYYTVSSAAIEKNDVLGVIVKTVPSFGKTVRAIVDNFLFILLGLVALAIIVTLILCLAFKKRTVRYDFDDDYYDDDFDSNEEESEPQNQEEQSEEKIADEYDDDSLFSGIE